MSASFSNPGAWIPLMDYAVKKGVSLSTLRRYIKADKIKHRTEGGRYLVWDEDSISAPATAPVNPLPVSNASASNEIVRHLEKRLRQSQEEIAELKMLIALYEEQIFRRRPSAEHR